MAFFFGSGEGALGAVQGVIAGEQSVLSAVKMRLDAQRVQEDILRLKQEREFADQLQSSKVREAESRALVAEQAAPHDIALRASTASLQAGRAREQFETETPRIAAERAQLATEEAKQRNALRLQTNVGKAYAEFDALPNREQLTPLQGASQLATMLESRGEFGEAAKVRSQGLVGATAGEQIISQQAVRSAETTAEQALASAAAQTQNPAQQRELVDQQLEQAIQNTSDIQTRRALQAVQTEIRKEDVTVASGIRKLRSAQLSLDAEQAWTRYLEQNPDRSDRPEAQFSYLSSYARTRGDFELAQKYRNSQRDAVYNRIDDLVGVRDVRELNAAVTSFMPQISNIQIDDSGERVTFTGADGKPQSKSVDDFRTLFIRSADARLKLTREEQETRIKAIRALTSAAGGGGGTVSIANQFGAPTPPVLTSPAETTPAAAAPAAAAPAAAATPATSEASAVLTEMQAAGLVKTAPAPGLVPITLPNGAKGYVAPADLNAQLKKRGASRDRAGELFAIGGFS